MPQLVHPGRVGGIGGSSLRPPSSYVASATKIAATQYASRGANLTGGADSKLGTVSFWVRRTSGASLQEIFNNANNKFTISWDAADKFSFVSFFGAPVQLSIITGSAYAASSSYHHVAASWNMGVPGSGRIVVDGVSDYVETTFNDSVLNYDRADTYVPDISPGLVGDLSEVYVNMAEYVDVLANNTLFRTAAGKPVDLGADGSVPTGTAPIIYFKESGAAFGTNAGTGGDFAQTNGPMTEAADAP